MNKIINKPSESSVYQRGVLDLSKTISIYEGIKNFVELEIKQSNKEIKIDNEEKVEVEEIEKVLIKENESNQDSSTNNDEPGSLFGISTYKSYIEWYHLKKLKVDDTALPEEIHNKINPKTFYNDKTKAWGVVYEGSRSNKENINNNFVVKEEMKIQTKTAPKNPFGSIETILSGTKRTALETENGNIKQDNPLKRKYFGEESENKLALLFKNKNINRKFKNRHNSSYDHISESNHSDVELKISSEYMTPHKELTINKELKEESPLSLTIHQSPSIIFQNFQEREDLIQDSSSRDPSSINVTPEKNDTPLKHDFNHEDSSIMSNNGIKSWNKSRSSSRYCGRKKIGKQLAH